MSQPFLLWLTGASGVGKSTAFHLLEGRHSNGNWLFIHQDGEPVPSRDAVDEQTAQMANIQEFLVHYWVGKIAESEAEVVVMDAQCHPRFVSEACERFDLTDFTIVLFHANWETMVERLERRGQSELATPDMKNWSRHLYDYAQGAKLPIVNTSQLTPEQIVEWLEGVIKSEGEK